MKFDEKLKNKFLLSKGLNFFKLVYFFNQKLRSMNKIKKSYSSNSVDLIINEFIQEIITQFVKKIVKECF